MFKLTMYSGEKVEISNDEHKRLMGRMSRVGKHFPIFELDSGDALFMDKIEFIKNCNEASKRITVGEITEKRLMAEAEKRIAEGDVAQTNADKLAEILAKSNCKHPEEQQQLWYSDTKMGTRYFRLCSVCGGNRTKFIGASKLSNEEKDAAQMYIEN